MYQQTVAAARATARTMASPAEAVDPSGLIHYSAITKPTPKISPEME